jgi:hypothetical protein
MTVAPPFARQSSTSTVTSPSGASVLVLTVALVTFAVGALAGYVYAHEPAAAELQARLTSSAPAPASSARGTLSTVAPDFIEVSTAAGPQRYRIERGTPVEELGPLTGAIPEGAPVNVGGHRTESGFVITGVVVLPADAR